MKSPALLTNVAALFIASALPTFAAAAAPNPAGTWKWTTPGRNGQSEETVLKLTVAGNGAVTGTLLDRAGEHPLTNLTVKDAKVDFTVLRDTPNGKVPIDYSLKLDGDRPKITIEYPDSAPAAKKAGKKRKREVEVVASSE
jgi:hypothetical protein